tara:strand:- start:413 stop:688 length:276 start_codon:yes stop_codon:yes gene_type:complete
MANNNDPCALWAKKLASPNERVTESDFIFECLRCLYHVSVIGLKINSNDPYLWSYKGQSSVSKSEVKRATHIKIHKMFRHYLEVSEKKFIV